MSDWSDIPVFLALMREGSAMAAARRLGSDQATVSRRLARLEAEIGLTLFERGPRGATPTANARALLPEAEAMERGASGLARRAETLRRDLSGTIRITTLPGGTRQFATILAGYLAEQPGVSLRIEETEVVRDLEAREADIAVRAVWRPEGCALIGRKLIDHPWAFYASREHCDRHGTPGRIEDLADHPLVFHEGPETDALGFVRDLQAELGPGAARLWVSGVEAMRAMLRRGAGMGLLSRSAGDIEPDLRLCFALPDHVQTLWLLWSRDAAAEPHIASFLAHSAAQTPGVLSALPREWRR